MVRKVIVRIGEGVMVEYRTKTGKKVFASLDFQAVTDKPRFTYLNDEVHILN